jgi:hypothetical protein
MIKFEVWRQKGGNPTTALPPCSIGEILLFKQPKRIIFESEN